MRDETGEPLLYLYVAQEPHDAVEQQRLHRRIERKLDFAGNAGIERVDFAVQIGHAVGIAHRCERRRDFGRCRAGLVGDPRDEGRPAAVDDRIRKHRRDNFAPQAMAMHRIGKTLGERLRKVAVEFTREVGVVRYPGRKKIAEQRELRIGEHHRELGPRQPRLFRAPLGDLRIARQEFDSTVEQTSRLQHLHQPIFEAEIVGRAALGERKCQRLQVIVAEHECCHLPCHVGEQLVARRVRKLALARGRTQRDLAVDLDVRGIDAGGIVDGVGVEPHALLRRLDAAALGHAQIRTLADHLAAELRCAYANRIIGAVADLLVALG